MAIDIKLGAIEADAIKLGSNDVTQVYLNGEALIDVGTVPIAPNAPTNFVASDDQVGQITFTWDNSTVGFPTPTYDIYRFNQPLLIATDVASPYTHSFTAGTNEYIVRAINSEGQADSNGDLGTALVATPAYNLTEAIITEA